MTVLTPVSSGTLTLSVIVTGTPPAEYDGLYWSSTTYLSSTTYPGAATSVEEGGTDFLTDASGGSLTFTPATDVVTYSAYPSSSTYPGATEYPGVLSAVDLVDASSPTLTLTPA